jgi:hypothetical protein
MPRIREKTPEKRKRSLEIARVYKKLDKGEELTEEEEDLRLEALLKRKGLLEGKGTKINKAELMRILEKQNKGEDLSTREEELYGQALEEAREREKELSKARSEAESAFEEGKGKE